jgi:5-methylcytosine-specific restriction endonuclease McrA
MRLTQKQRKAVWDKSGGLCWYCGVPLPEKGWHADHFHPVIRESVYQSQGHGTGKMVATGSMLRAHLDTLENMVPSCAPCNLFKSTYDVEFFRQEIAAQIDRCWAASSGFRIAVRLDQIECKPEQPVVFWFEREGLPAPTTKGA